MDEDFGYEFDEGSDMDNWEDEMVFQDGVAEREAMARDAIREDIAYEVARRMGQDEPCGSDYDAADRILLLIEGV